MSRDRLFLTIGLTIGSLILFPWTVPSAHSQTTLSVASPIQARISVATDIPQFDVISIRALKEDTTAYGWGFEPNSFTASAFSPEMLVRMATGFSDVNRIKGMPGWAATHKYNVSAKVVTALATSLKDLNDAQQDAMILSILTSRFHFSSHLESAEVPVYALVVAKGGVKNMTPHAAGITLADKWGGGPLGYIKAKAVTMAELAGVLNVVDDRTVLDRTNLPGSYAFELHFDHTATSSVANGYRIAAYYKENATWPSLYKALPEQLGLKLEPTKAKMPVLVIDHIELPSEN